MGLSLIRDDTSVSMYEGGTGLLWAAALRPRIGLETLGQAVRHSHTGSFKDWDDRAGVGVNR